MFSDAKQNFFVIFFSFSILPPLTIPIPVLLTQDSYQQVFTFDRFGSGFQGKISDSGSTLICIFPDSISNSDPDLILPRLENTKLKIFSYLEIKI